MRARNWFIVAAAVTAAYVVWDIWHDLHHLLDPDDYRDKGAI